MSLDVYVAKKYCATSFSCGLWDAVYEDHLEDKYCRVWDGWDISDI